MFAKVPRSVGNFSPPVRAQIINSIQAARDCKLPVQLRVLSQKCIVPEIIDLENFRASFAQPAKDCWGRDLDETVRAKIFFQILP